MCALCIPINYLGNLMKQKQEDAETEMRHLSHSQMLFVNYCEQRSNKRDNYANFNHIWTQIHILLYHYVIRSHPYITLLGVLVDPSTQCNIVIVSIHHKQYDIVQKKKLEIANFSCLTALSPSSCTPYMGMIYLVSLVTQTRPDR